MDSVLTRITAPAPLRIPLSPGRALGRSKKFLYTKRKLDIFNHMVNYSSLNAVFSALADPTRRAILARLAQGETSVGEVARPFAMSLPAVSKHLKVLANAGLITRQRDGRVRRLGLNPAPMAEAAAWITHYRRFWEDQFDALARYLDENDPQMRHEPKEETP